MPCIQLTVSQKLTEQNKVTIKSRLGQAIQILPGKSESWLMVIIHDDACMYFKGNQNAPMAFADVSVYGNENGNAFNNLTMAICDILNEEIGTPADRIYVKYSATQHWGWNGGNF